MFCGHSHIIIVLGLSATVVSQLLVMCSTFSLPNYWDTMEGIVPLGLSQLIRLNHLPNDSCCCVYNYQNLH